MLISIIWKEASIAEIYWVGGLFLRGDEKNSAEKQAETCSLFAFKRQDGELPVCSISVQ
jgi:hypothetical protein